MQDANQRPTNTSLPEHVASPAADNANVPAWVSKLGEMQIARLLRRAPGMGEPNPDHWAAVLADTGLSTNDFCAAIRNPSLPDLYCATDEAIERVQYVWDYWTSVRRSIVHSAPKDGLCDLAEFDGLHFVREYGGKACAIRFSGDEMVVQTIAELKRSYPDKRVKVLNEKGQWTTKNAIAVLEQRDETWTYDKAIWKPGRAAQARELNLWRGWRLPLDESEAGLALVDTPLWPRQLARMMYHVEEVMCNGNLEHADWLLLWLAHALQRPWENSEIALVLIGPMGSGKDFFAEAMGSLFAPYKLTLDKPGQLTGNFNSHLQRALWAIATEGFFASRAQADTLKALITADSILIEPKGLNAFMAAKSFRLVITANRLSSVHIEDGDRRYFVLNVDGGENNKNPDYHGPLRDEWYTYGGREAFFEWLRGPYWQRRLVEDKRLLRTRPTTQTLRDARLQSLNKYEMAIHNMLMQGQPPCTVQYRANDHVFLPTAAFVREARLEDRDVTAVGVLLAKLAVASERVMMEHYGQVQGRILPPLAECRARWEAHLGQPVHWEQGPAEWAGAHVAPAF